MRDEEDCGGMWVNPNTLREVPPEIIKTCGCSASYTRATWDALPFAYVGDLHEDGDQRCEFRHCPCGSTIAIDLQTGKSVGRDDIPAEGIFGDGGGR